MLRSYTASAAGGRVVLRREVLSELGIGQNAVLYGAFCPPEGTAILSPIPPDYWDRAHKIIVHCKQTPGSLAAVAAAVAELDIGVVASWASNESASSHLSCTFVVVIDPGLLKSLGGQDGLHSSLRKTLKSRLSDLPQFLGEAGALSQIRITPLAFLSAYHRQLAEAEWHRVHVEGHSLDLDKTTDHLMNRRGRATLWQTLLNACQCQSVSACILSCDTEEALLRVAPIMSTARLCQIELRLTVTSDDGEFPGYWQSALDAIAAQGCPVYIAQNLLISKTREPPSEKARFSFTVDVRDNADAGRSLQELRKEWTARFEKRFAKLAQKRTDRCELDEVRISRPHGVGVPCFLATNAKRGGIEARVAVAICKLLEGHGFKPVSVEIAANKAGLREEVCSLVKACHFMVVLHCPERKLVKPDRSYGVSQWVAFEEGLMQAHGGHVLTLLFENVSPPDYSDRVWVQFPHLETDAEGLDARTIDEISARLMKWETPMMRYESSIIDEEITDRDLVAYYGNE